MAKKKDKDDCQAQRAERGTGAFIVSCYDGGQYGLACPAEYKTREAAERHAEELRQYKHDAKVYARGELIITYSVKPCAKCGKPLHQSYLPGQPERCGACADGRAL